MFISTLTYYSIYLIKFIIVCCTTIKAFHGHKEAQELPEVRKREMKMAYWSKLVQVNFFILLTSLFHWSYNPLSGSKLRAFANPLISCITFSFIYLQIAMLNDLNELRYAIIKKHLPKEGKKISPPVPKWQKIPYFLSTFILLSWVPWNAYVCFAYGWLKMHKTRNPVIIEFFSTIALRYYIQTYKYFFYCCQVMASFTEIIFLLPLCFVMKRSFQDMYEILKKVANNREELLKLKRKWIIFFCITFLVLGVVITDSLLRFADLVFNSRDSNKNFIASKRIYLKKPADYKTPEMARQFNGEGYIIDWCDVVRNVIIPIIFLLNSTFLGPMKN